MLLKRNKFDQIRVTTFDSSVRINESTSDARRSNTARRFPEVVFSVDAFYYTRVFRTYSPRNLGIGLPDPIGMHIFMPRRSGEDGFYNHALKAAIVNRVLKILPNISHVKMKKKLNQINNMHGGNCI